MIKSLVTKRLAIATLGLAGLAYAIEGRAANGTWANPALTNANGLLDAGTTMPDTANVRWVDALTATTEFPAQDGDVFRITGTVTGTGFAANTAYFVVNTPTPSNVFQLAASPTGAPIVNPTPGGAPVANRYFRWNDAANWVDGTIPNGADNIATFTGPGAQTRIVLGQDVTLGGIVFDGNGPNDLEFYGGHVSAPRTLTFATTTGTPTIAITGGVRPIGMPNNNNNGLGLNIAGTQGLRLDLAGTGAFRVNTGVNWSGFSGTLTVARGNLDPVAGPNTIPMTRLVLGESSNYARLGMFTNRNQSIGGFDGNANSFVGNNGTGFSTLTVGNNNESGSFAGTFGRNDAANDLTNNLYRSMIHVIKVGGGVQKFTGTSFGAGTTTVNGGSFLLNGVHTATGVVAGNLAATTGTFGQYAVNNGGTLGGTGAITPFDDGGVTQGMVSVNDGGFLSPGDGGIGTLTINGGSSLSSVLSLALNGGNGGGKGLFDLGASSASDKLALVGAQASDVIFNSNVLNFNALAGAASGDYTLFTADAANAYAGLTVGGGGLITGGLSIGAGLGAGSSLKLVGNNIVVSAVIAATQDADFDNDNNVDGDDFLIWQRGLGAMGTGTNGTGDANGDMNVDGADLAVWRNKFGMPPATGAAGAVPEPAALALAWMTAGALATFRRQRRIGRN